MIYDWATMALVHFIVLGCIAIGEARLLVLFWWRLYCCYKELITVAGLFFLLILLVFLGVCISNVIRALHCYIGWV
jgi:hypothetical protein